METLKINIPKGYEVDTFDEKTGEIKFKETPKNVKERIKTFADVLAELGEDDPEVILFRQLTNAIHTSKNHIISYQSVVLIAKALNEGWTPDWDNGEWDKYFPWFNMSSSGSGFSSLDFADWYSSSGVASRLCFKTADLAEYAANQFTDIYKHFFILNS